MSDSDISIEEVRSILDGLEKEGVGLKCYHFPHAFQPVGLLKGGNPGETMVSAGDAFVELGHPTTVSLCLSVLTKRGGLVVDGRVTVVGKEIQELNEGRHHFALIVLAEAGDLNERCRRTLARKMTTCDSLSGCMVRALSDRIWVRVGQEALTR